MRVLSASLFMLATLGTALAQTPFDMSPERPPVQERPQPVPPPAARPQEPASPADATTRRYLLPSDPLVFDGEIASRSWAVYLTDAEAAATTRMHLAYQNAIFVAPEGSRLAVSINGASLVDEPVSSPQEVKKLAVPVPQGTLKPGRNDITMSVQQRHRTDCTIASTYELWTELDAPETFLVFEGDGTGRLGGFQDLRAIGGDPSGRARVDIVAPSTERTDIRADLMALAQVIGLYVNHPNVDFSISSRIEGDGNPTVRVLLGTAEELRPVTGSLPAGSELGPTAAFLDASEGSPATLVVTGRSDAEWKAAIAQMRAPVDRPADTRRQTVATQSWRTPEAPMIYSAERLTFSQLGIRSEQFSGRRYHSSFQFAVPADFYADSYGEARILLDAAYSSAVRPGSLINIHVNGNIAATVPITQRNGAVLNKYPVKVTMRHFRPGLNEVALDVELVTDQDAACLPGATTDTTPRFAIFGTSEFAMPDFARIAQRPNLAALAGTGFPYGRESHPVALVSERSDVESLAAAADIMARLALSAGRVIPVTFTSTTDGARGSNALFVGAIGNIPPMVLAQVGVDPNSGWGRAPDAASPGAEDISIDAWRRQVGDGWFRQFLSDVESWMSRTFNITVDMLRFVPTRSVDFVPGPDVGLMVAQGQNPAGTGVWTVVTAPDPTMLRQGMGGLTAPLNWTRLSGAITTLERDNVTLASVPVSTFAFVQTQPSSLANYRLIVANFLSSNILSYSLVLVVACVLLGIFTSGLLSRLGRRH